MFSTCSVAYSQSDSVLVSLSQLRRANELIVQGQYCFKSDSLKSKSIEYQQNQILELNKEIEAKDGIIVNYKEITNNLDSINNIHYKIEKSIEKDIKKHKFHKIVLSVIIIAAIIL